MFIKGVAVTGFPYSLINTSGNAVTTGTPSGYITKNGGTQTPLTNNSVHEGNGQWSVDLTADEMNADVIGLIFTHTSAIPVSFTIATYTSSEVVISTSGTFLGDQVGPTSFTSSDVLQRVRKITNRHIDSIADELYEVLLDISNRGYHLKTSSSGTNSSGIISLPANIVSLSSVTWNGNLIGPITWDEYVQNIKNGYVRKGNSLYIRPTPTAATAYELDYECYHPNDLNTIMYGMPFFMCVVYGVVSKCFENFGPMFSDSSDKYFGKYESELEKLSQTIENGPPIVARLTPMRTNEDY